MQELADKLVTTCSSNGRDNSYTSTNKKAKDNCDVTEELRSMIKFWIQLIESASQSPL